MSHLQDTAWSEVGDKAETMRPSYQDVQRVIWFIFVLLFALLLLLYIVFIPGGGLLDADLYWHIATGRRIWEGGSFPQVDEFSHTFRGHPWIARDWLGDLSFFGAYNVLGLRGVAM